MQYFPFFDRIDLDQCQNKNEKINTRSLTAHSNIYRAIYALFFSFLKIKASPEGLKIKK